MYGPKIQLQKEIQYHHRDLNMANSLFFNN